MKQWQSFLLVFLVIIFVSIYAGRDSLAAFVWQKYRSPQIAILLDRSNAELAMFIGNYYFNGIMGGGKYNLDVAQKAYKKAVSINPNILWGHYQLSRIAFVKGDFNLALEEIAKELEANPENLRSLYVRGLIYGYRLLPGDLELAEADFRRFTLWAPKEWAGYNDLAWILSKAGKYDEAKTAINKAMLKATDASNNPWLWNSLGVALLNLGKMGEAKTAFENALRYSEGLTEAEWRRAYPGNNPASAGEGSQAFRNAIKENLRRAGSEPR